MLRHRLVRTALVRLLGGLAVGAPLAGAAEETPLLAIPRTPASGAAPADRALLGSLRTAVRAGLPSLAESFAADALKKYAGDPAILRTVRLELADARLQKSDFDGVLAVLADIPGDDAAKSLREGLAAYGLGRIPEARNRLAAAGRGPLDNDDPAWRDTLVALIAADDGRAGDSERAFNDALAKAANLPLTKFQIGLLRARARIRTRHDNNLAGMLDPGSDARQAYRLAKLRAITLGLEGKPPVDAIRELDKVPLADADLIADRHLTTGLLWNRNASDGGGGRNPEGRAALLAAVKTGEGFPDIQRAALAELRQAVLGAKPQETGINANLIYPALTDIVNARPAGGVADMIHYVRADIMFEAARRAATDADRAEYTKNAREAVRALEKFPNSPIATDGLALAAGIAWSNGEQLRAADAYYALATTKGSVGASRGDLYLAAADGYFIGKDYARAADAYRAARREGLSAAKAGNAFVDEIRATLLDESSPDRVSNAAKILAEAGSTLPAASRLQAEWLVADREFQAGDYVRSQTLVTRALADVADPGMTVRFLWLRTRIEQNTRRYDAAAATTAKIAAIVESPAGAAVPEIAANRDTILAQTKRLRALAILGDRNIEAAAKEFADLRKQYPGQAAAADSYLDEGRFRSDRGEHREAYRILKDGYDLFKDNAKLSENAANLLFEAGKEALTLAGSDSGMLDTASRDFDTLRRNHPQSPHFFRASLYCGDILRLQNRFDEARTVYQILVAAKPDDPDRLVADLAIADCYLEKGARGATEESGENYANAAKDYARLVNLPHRPADLAAEAACKRAIAASKAPARGVTERETGERLARTEAAKTLFATTELLLGTKADCENLGPTGRYWIVRSFLLIARLYAADGGYAEARNTLSRALEYNRNLPEGMNRLPFEDVIRDDLKLYTRPHPAGS